MAYYVEEKVINRLIAIDRLTVCGFKSLLLGIFFTLSQPSMWIISHKPHAISDIEITHNLHRHQKTNIDISHNLHRHQKTDIDIRKETKKLT